MQVVAWSRVGIVCLAMLNLVACGKEETGASPKLAETVKSSQGVSVQEETRWESLVPENWNPEAVFQGVDIGKFEDNDPKALDLMLKLRQSWDHAPVNSAMNGKDIRIPGYVVPLERLPEGIQEFLLVPYFGACVHVPPPPANQIIHVLLDKPMDQQTMSAVWVRGKLETMRSETEMGKAGYRVQHAQVEAYEKP